MISRKNSLSNFDRNHENKVVDDFKGVYMKDQLPDKLERGFLHRKFSKYY